MNEIKCGDCLKVLPTLPKARMIFADPPDNLGVGYAEYKDEREDYDKWIGRVMLAAIYAKCDVFWLSFNSKYHQAVWSYIDTYTFHRLGVECREYIWRFAFGQHSNKGCGQGYRPLLCIKRKGVQMYPEAIMEPSARQLKYKDKRASPEGRVPDDVWQFSRVCGTFKDRRKWHPNQRPEDLMRRMIFYSTKPGDLVIDMFAGTGTTNRACWNTGRDCIGIEQSRYYCKMIRKDMQTWPSL